MFINGLGTANPPQRYTKTECWEALTRSEWLLRLDRRARSLVETVLRGDNGIESRWLALNSLSEAFRIDPDTMHRRFESHAPALAAQAARRALSDARILPTEVDAVIVSTCTGYLCPGLSSYVMECLGLRPDVQAFDLVGQGCVAALPNWRMADALLATGSCHCVLSVCVELSSAAMYLDNDPGVLISACLFGDGAGAVLLGAKPSPHKRRIEWKICASLLNPAERDALRFEQRGGLLRNVLTRPVPQLAAEYAQRVLDGVLGSEGLSYSDIKAWIWHAGGRDVLIALQNRLGLSGEELRYSTAMLREYGNLSSAFVYFVLQAALADDAPGGWWWVSSFGAGFSCYGAMLEVA